MPPFGSTLNGAEVTLLATVVLIAAFGWFAARRSSLPLPPGPNGLPFIGNALQIPPAFQYLKFQEWANKYGPIVRVNVFGRTMIILGTTKATSEFLEKRLTTYSDRPKFPMLVDLVGYDRLTVWMPVDTVWKEHRKYFYKLFGTKAAVSKFFDMEVLEARRFMRNLLREPERLHELVGFWTGSLSLKITYGYETKPGGRDELIDLVNKTMEQFTHAQTPAAFLVDQIPILKYVPAWVPGANFKRLAVLYSNTLKDMIDVPFEMVQRQLKAGVAKQSFTSDLLTSDDYTKDQEYSLKTSAATIFAAGAETTAGQFHGLALMFMVTPRALKKAQEEIDRVVGSDRLPDYKDRASLPYVDACIAEAMRLHVLAPFGGLRVAPKDDIVDGYFIPKDALIQPNLWQMAHDPEVYPDPLNFVPERWLVENPPPHPREVSFGFGRRICPGILLADASMFIATAMFLALFDIKRVEGSPESFNQMPGGVLDGQAICHPHHFKSDIKPRSAKAEALILSIEHDL